MADIENDEDDQPVAPNEIISRDQAMENTMRETMKDIQARETEKSAPKEAAPDDVPATGETDKSEQHRGEKPRDATGKFKPAKAAEAPGEKSLEDQGAEEGKPEQPQGQKPQAVTQAPSSWSTEARAEWDKLPPVVRAQALKREQDISRVVQQSADRIKRAESIEKIIEPHKGLLSQAYQSTEAGVSDLLATFKVARENPLGFAAWFIQTRGIDPRQLLGVSQGGAQQAPTQADPAMAAILNRVQGIEGKFTEREQAEKERLNVLAAQSWESFAADPKNKFIEEVKADMADLLEKGLAGSYQEAYEKAVRLRDDLFEQSWQEKQQDAEKAKQAEREKQAKEARKGATMAQVTRPNAGATPSTPKSWEDTLRDKHKEMQGRAA